jgi:hypothetical protein
LDTKRLRWPIAILGSGVLGWTLATGFDSSTKEPVVADPGPASQRPEFEAIAEKVSTSKNIFVGRGSADELIAALPTSDPKTPEGRTLRSRLAQELLRFGEIDRAIQLMDEAIAAVDGTPILLQEAELLRVRAIAHLRKAEIENCVNRHNRDCCIFPLEGGGVHAVSSPARMAKEDFIRYLEVPPLSEYVGGPIINNESRIAAGWLLNIACMALDEYPQGVPKKYRIAPSTFASDADIGRFVDVAPQLGLDAFDHAGGAIVDDFDGDGFLDVVSSTCDVRGSMKAFRNRGDGTFEDIAKAWRLDDQLGGLHIAGADYDNDGDLDILVPRGAWMLDEGAIRKSLLRNDGPAGFTDVTGEAGLAEFAAPTQAVVWADFDNDGWLDLYVGHESRIETERGGTSYPSQLFRNQGDGTFADVTSGSGVANNRYTKGVAAGDYDNDGDMDLYVSNIGCNRLYRNDGGMKFEDVAPELGVRDPVGRSFATWFYDHDNDGDLDLWVNAYEGRADAVLRSAQGIREEKVNCLYRNEGNGTFTNIASEVGVDKVWLPMGSSFGDFDNDGWLDVYLGTGDPAYETLVPNIALRNDQGRRYQDISQSSGLGHLQKGHEIVFVDIDDDGDQDIFHQLGGFFPGDAFRNALLLNPGNENHFLKIDLVGNESNRQGIGVRIAVEINTPSGKRTVHRAAGSVSSFGQCPRRQEIGLGNATSIESVEVFWPKSGFRRHLKGVELDSFIRITEGESGFETLPLRPVLLVPAA